MATYTGEFEKAVERAKREINEDIAYGIVPATVSSFSELHDHVDGNEYGGACEAGAYPDTDNDPDEVLEAFAAGWNLVQNTVKEWVVDGRPEGRRRRSRTKALCS